MNKPNNDTCEDVTIVDKTVIVLKPFAHKEDVSWFCGKDTYLINALPRFLKSCGVTHKIIVVTDDGYNAVPAIFDNY